MDSADPSVDFFPDGTDLYSALNVDAKCSAEDIRRAYRKLSLIHHPDKVATRSTEAQEEAKAAFQRVGYAYAVLSDEKRRSRYDKTGRTDDSALDVEPDDGWEAYFAELWDGEVNAETLDDFFDTYEGSSEEVEDLTAAFDASGGDIEYILAHVPARDNTIAEARFTNLVQNAIEHGTLKITPAWSKSMKDAKGRLKRQKQAEREAREAAKAAKELGVHEKLFGGSKKGNKADEVNGEAALKALIQQRGAARMDALIDNLEAKYGHSEMEQKKRKGMKKDRDQGSKKSRSEPTEEEFQRAQAGVDARRVSERRHDA